MRTPLVSNVLLHTRRLHLRRRRKNLYNPTCLRSSSRTPATLRHRYRFGTRLLVDTSMVTYHELLGVLSVVSRDPSPLFPESSVHNPLVLLQPLSLLRSSLRHLLSPGTLHPSWRPLTLRCPRVYPPSESGVGPLPLARNRQREPLTTPWNPLQRNLNTPTSVYLPSPTLH